MKKLLLLYLLLAITFIGCSSDDNSNEEPANQLFLDIYDGVVWQRGTNEDIYKVTFNSDPSGIIQSFDGSCDTLVFGEPFPITDDDVVIGEVTYTIQNEGQSSIVLFGQFVFNDGNTNPENITITCTVSSGGNTLLVENSYSSGDGELQGEPQTYTIAPEEFPCN